MGTLCCLELNMAFFHRHQGFKTGDEKNQGYLPRPFRHPEQRRAPANKSLRRGIHSMGQRTLPATSTDRHSTEAQKWRLVVLWVALRGYGLGSLGLDTQSKSDRCRGTNGRHNGGTNGCSVLQLLLWCALIIAAETKHQTHLAWARGQGHRYVRGPIQPLQSLSMVPRWKLHTCSGCVCCWAVSVLCVLAMSLRIRLSQARTTSKTAFFLQSRSQNIAKVGQTAFLHPERIWFVRNALIAIFERVTCQNKRENSRELVV